MARESQEKLVRVFSRTGFSTRPLVSLLTLVCPGVRSAPRQSTGANPKEKESKFIMPEAIQGCYELGTLNWKPDLQLDKDELVFITPPARIELLAKRGTEERELQDAIYRVETVGLGQRTTAHCSAR
jgi:hypothetical protein